jgi:hypothetical protein
MGKKPNHELMSIDCKNCGTVFQGRFCPQCGQKASTGRLTVGHVLEEGWHSVTHTDKSFLSLLGALLGRPGLVINEFIAGKRKKYFNPYMFYVVVTGLLIFVTIKVFAREDRLFHYNNEFARVVYEEYELLVLFSIPVLSLFCRLVFLRGKYNYAEWATVLIFAFGLANFVELPIQLFYLIFVKYHFGRNPYTSLIDYLVLAYVLTAVVGGSKWWHWLQVAICVGFVYLFITYVADPVALLLSGMSWEAVQYSF